MHYHMPARQRAEIYRFLAEAVRDAWRGRGKAPIDALCKEPRNVRRPVALDHDMCNCG